MRLEQHLPKNSVIVKVVKMPDYYDITYESIGIRYRTKLKSSTIREKFLKRPIKEIKSKHPIHYTLETNDCLKNLTKEEFYKRAHAGATAFKRARENHIELIIVEK